MTRFKELQRGDIIEPCKSWGWPTGLLVVDTVKPDMVYVIKFDTPGGVGFLTPKMWRSKCHVGALESDELVEFIDFVDRKYPVSRQE